MNTLSPFATLVIGTIIGLVIKYFWDMLVSGDKKYLLRSVCKTCSAHKQTDDIVAIKQLLLIIVVKLNIPPEQYQRLVGQQEH